MSQDMGLTYLRFSSGNGSSWPGPPWHRWLIPTPTDPKHFGRWEQHHLVVRGANRSKLQHAFLIPSLVILVFLKCLSAVTLGECVLCERMCSCMSHALGFKTNQQAESKQLTLSCEHFDVDGALDTDLLTDLWSKHLLLDPPGTTAVTWTQFLQ